MKKLATIFIAICVIFVFGFGTFIFKGVRAETNSSTEYVVDPKCSAVSILDPTLCSIECKKECVEDGRSCAYNNKNVCIDIEDASVGEIENSVNFSGINLGPPETLVPTVSRILLTVAFAVIALATLFMAIYGLIVRTTASESPEKIELSAKIFKNALIGLAISTVGILIVQVIATLFGISNGIFDFYLVPPIYIESTNVACEPGTRGFTRDGDNLKYYFCSSAGEWQVQ